MSLFKPDTGRAHTSFAYGLNYLPKYLLTSGQKKLIQYQTTLIMSKTQLLYFCNEELTHIVSPMKPDTLFKINWIYNNIPTVTEWEKIADSSTFRVELRVSPVCENSGRVVIVEPVEIFKHSSL